jgi:HSP20 family protein
MSEASEEKTPSQSKPSESPQTGQQRASATAQGTEGERQQGGVSRRDWFTPSLWMDNPLAVMRRFAEEIDSLFEDFGVGRSRLSPFFGRSREWGQSVWHPQIEVCEQDNQLVVCADLPGLKKEDIKVEVTDEAITIQGERKQESINTQGGYRRSERSYGSFYRSIPLPEGVDPEKARATFQDGVLKITVPMPQREEPRRRRIEIQGAETQPAGGQTGTAGQSPTQSAS